MVSKGDYPRWLKDSEGWTADDDWEPDEYLQWFQRLSDAKKNLKNLYVEVDTQAIQLLKELCESFKSELPADVNLSGKVGHLIARFGVAYNFYNRISFEDLPESKAVGRVQKYLPRLRIGMHTKDIARMLQAAADKVLCCPSCRLDRDDADKAALGAFQQGC